MDKMDEKIVEMLSDDARVANTEIAERLGISEAAVRNRIENMREEGVIKKFTIEIDPAKIGYDSVALVGVDVEPDMFLKAANKLSELEEVRDIALTTGDHMIMMEIWAENERDLTRILSEKVGKLEGVKRICPAVVLEKLE